MAFFVWKQNTCGMHLDLNAIKISENWVGHFFGQVSSSESVVLYQICKQWQIIALEKKNDHERSELSAQQIVNLKVPN